MKTPPTFAERARRLSEQERLQYAKVRELFEDLEELKDPAETYANKEATEALESLAEAIEALTTLINAGASFGGEHFTDAAAWIETMSTTLPSTEAIQLFMDEMERLETALDEMAEHRDDPSGYTQEEKAGARNEVRSALEDLADALDGWDSPDQ
jgi:protein-tyrosine-phosphatase